jgi:hypothetical protein
MSDGKWQFHTPIIGRKYKVAGGETGRETLIMRRWLASGEWQYRLPTEAERSEWIDRLQW